MPEVNMYCTPQEKLEWGLEDGEFETIVGKRPREFYEPFFKNRSLRETYKKILSEKKTCLNSDEKKEFIIEAFEFFIQNYYSSLLKMVDFEVFDKYGSLGRLADWASKYKHSLYCTVGKEGSVPNPTNYLKKCESTSSHDPSITDLFFFSQNLKNLVCEKTLIYTPVHSMESLLSYFEYEMRRIFNYLSRAFLPSKSIPLWNGKDQYEYLYVPWHYSRSLKSSLPFKPIYYRCPLVYGTVLKDTPDYFPFFLLNKGAFRAFIRYEDPLYRGVPRQIQYEKKITVPNLYEIDKTKISDFSFNVVVNDGLMIYPLMHGYVVGDESKMRLLKLEDAHAFVNEKLFLSVDDFLPFDYLSRQYDGEDD